MHIKAFPFTLALVTSFAVSTSGQMVGRVIDAPFSAIGRNSSGQPIQEFARASNGSIYEASLDRPDGPLKGKTFLIHIDDVPYQCGISINISVSNLDFVLFPRRQDPLHTVDQERAQLRRLQKGWTDNPERTVSYGIIRHASLGEKSENGMMLFGFHSETTPDSERYFVDERWRSDLGVDISHSHKDLRNANSQTGVEYLTDLHRGEPDPKLFLIPPETLPHAEEFLNARRIFVDEKTSHHEITARVMNILSTIGGLEMVKDKADADLVLVIKDPTHMQGIHQIYLDVYGHEPNRALLQVTLETNQTSSEWIDSKVTDSCLPMLWSRIESVNRH